MFTKMRRAFTHGYEAKRPDGITVEVVRCYANEWDVFLTKDDHVVACSITAFRAMDNGRRGGLSFQAAMRIGREEAR